MHHTPYFYSLFFKLFSTPKIVTFFFVTFVSLCHGAITETVRGSEGNASNPDILTITIDSNTFRTDIEERNGTIKLPVNNKKLGHFASLSVSKGTNRPILKSKASYAYIRVEYRLINNPENSLQKAVKRKKNYFPSISSEAKAIKIHTG